MTYESNKVFTEKCCIDPGVHSLRCEVHGAQGWNGAKIEILGNTYCENFNKFNGFAWITDVAVPPGKVANKHTCTFISLFVTLGDQLISVV